MAINDKRLEVTEFDFDDVKDNLKTFLKAQDEFTDYDFEGSGMSTLLDVLAYNTHYLGFNANMLANEMFLDSASLRSSIVSHAKTLGYVPSSARAAKATVDVTLNTNSSTATMPAGTVFNTTVDDTTFQFSTIESFGILSERAVLGFLPFLRAASLSSKILRLSCLVCIITDRELPSWAERDETAKKSPKNNRKKSFFKNKNRSELVAFKACFEGSNLRIFFILISALNNIFRLPWELIILYFYA